MTPILGFISSRKEGLWYTEDFPEPAWLQHLGFLAARYRDNPRVVGFDIRNLADPMNLKVGVICP